ncbi:uncharacterized protein TNCV_3619351 [Trichonephila clavipes]|nr:uncharacterized protein TNCV_3619351 [Trichonephila clavipes]
MQKTRQHLMNPNYFRCCCPRLHPFHRRQGPVLLAWKSQSRHHFAFEIHSLLHRMPSRFLIFFIAFLKSSDRLDKLGNLLPVVVIGVFRLLNLATTYSMHFTDSEKLGKKLVRIFDAPDNKRFDKRCSTVLHCLTGRISL